jgi:hypothetical protein
MPIDIPKHIRAEAQRAEFFAELVKRADRLNSLEQAEADSLAAITKNREEADQILKRASIQCGKSIAMAKDDHAKAADSLAIAKEQSEQLLEDAKVQAQSLLLAAQEAADAQKATDDAAKSQLIDTRLQIEQAQALLSDLNDQVSEAQAVIAKAEAIKKAMG